MDSPDGAVYSGMVTDGFKGETRALSLTSKQLSMVFAVNMGEPAFYEAELEPLFKDWPPNLRPIP